MYPRAVGDEDTAHGLSVLSEIRNHMRPRPAWFHPEDLVSNGRDDDVVAVFAVMVPFADCTCRPAGLLAVSRWVLLARGLPRRQLFADPLQRLGEATLKRNRRDDAAAHGRLGRLGPSGARRSAWALLALGAADCSAARGLAGLLRRDRVRAAVTKPRRPPRLDGAGAVIRLSARGG